MHPRFALLLPACLLALTSCDQPAAPKPEAPAAVTAPAPMPEAPKDTPEQLAKLQGELPRMDPEKAKFIAVPSTPPDPKPVVKPPSKEKQPEEVKKATPAK